MMGIWKQSLFVSCLTAFGLSVHCNASAGLMVTSTGASVGIDFAGFRGSGFAPGAVGTGLVGSGPPATGLDSNHWRIEGLSDGAGVFGGTYLAGDFARGSSVGGVSSGGIYGFDVGSGSVANWALGFQPTGSDLTPGTITLMVTNATGSSVDQVDLGYRVLRLNNGDRSGSMQFAYSLDDISYDLVSSVGAVVSPGPIDPNPV